MSEHFLTRLHLISFAVTDPLKLPEYKGSTLLE